MTDENLVKWKIITNMVFERRICQSFELLRRHGIEPVLIKGWAAARNYPNVYERIFTDIDLAVAETDYNKALQLAGEHQLYLDIHKELRRLDVVNWEKLFAASRLEKLEGSEVRILCPEDHLRVLCVHWLNDGGVDKEKLWDIHYAVENRPPDFDWKRCLEAAGAKRKKWIICAIGLAEKYFGLDLSETPLAGQTNNIPVWLLRAVEKEWSRGIKLKALENCVNNKNELLEQIKIRIPPNPIQASIETESEFDEKSRFVPLIANILLRFKLSAKRIMRNRRNG